MDNTVWKHLGAIDPPRQGLSYTAVHDLISDINYINSTKTSKLNKQTQVASIFHKCKHTD